MSDKKAYAVLGLFETPDALMHAIPKLRAVEATGTPVTMADPGFTGCRWPINTPNQNDAAATLFCCGPRLPGRVYCEGHRAVAYVAPSKKSNRNLLRLKVWA